MPPLCTATYSKPSTVPTTEPPERTTSRSPPSAPKSPPPIRRPLIVPATLTKSSPRCLMLFRGSMPPSNCPARSTVPEIEAPAFTVSEVLPKRSVMAARPTAPIIAPLLSVMVADPPMVVGWDTTLPGNSTSIAVPLAPPDTRPDKVIEASERLSTALMSTWMPLPSAPLPMTSPAALMVLNEPPAVTT